MSKRNFIWAMAVIGATGFLTATAQTPARTYTIQTIAGGGTALPWESNGDGGPATSATLLEPSAVERDRRGNLYIYGWDARVRKVSAETGIITTIAGTGIAGFSGDGGPAVNAQLGGPGSLTLDNLGNLYIGDSWNHRIRKINARTGIITTIAGNGDIVDSGDGGPATTAGVAVAGLAVDRENNIYVTNSGDRVRKIDAQTGLINTYAGGNGSKYSGDGSLALWAQIDQPEGLAFDLQQNLYIATAGEHRIRKVTQSNGIINTIAGNSPGYDTGILGLWVYIGGYSGDGGPAVDALLNVPQAVATDLAGNVYIADTENQRIRKVDARSGIITTIAGTGVAGFSGDGGPATAAAINDPCSLVVSPSGQIYFADISNNRVRVLTPHF